MSADGPDESQVRALARKYALQNAIQHAGAANPGAVVGRIMAEAAELRPHSKTIMPWIQAAVGEVNGLDVAAQKAALAGLDPSMLEKKKKERGHPFKTLPGYADHDKIVMRFAPNPNGPATMGHSRGMVTMAEYKRIAQDDGKEGVLVLRFDDTDPQVKPPYMPAYDWLQEDYAWLGATVDRVVIASERIPEYYHVAEQLIEKDAAYVCFCTQEVAKGHRDAGEPCPHRDVGADASLDAWRGMLDGAHAEGSATLRIKTQVDHKDPALRDWVGMRIVTAPHPRVGDTYRVWPMLDFESAVEDRLQGVTHIIRGKDLRDSTERQKFLYAHMGWTYPETLYWGRVRLDELGSFSSSGMRKAIEAGEFTGWDDPRLPTLRAFRRRGIRPEALRAFWVGMGLSEKDVAASLMNLYAENDKAVEKESDRLFFVREPSVTTLDAAMVGADALHARTPVHPDFEERGGRTHTLDLVGGEGRLLLAGDDVAMLSERGAGALVRLKDLGNAEVVAGAGVVSLRWVGDDLQAARAAKAPVIHWLPASDDATVPCTVLRPEPFDDPLGLRHDGRIEKAVLEYGADRVVQMERYGFARLESVDAAGVVAVFTHR